jgi:hypothetical protein
MQLLTQLTRIFFGNQYSEQIDDIAYHECGHVVIASLFEDVFDIQFVTVDSAVSQSHDATTLGGMRGRLKNKPNSMSILEVDAFILIQLAGMCADDINNTRGKIPKNYYSQANWVDRFNRPRYGGDLELVGKFFPLIKDKVSVTWQDYVVNSIKALHEIFSNILLWESVSLLRSTLQKTGTLKSSEINKCLNNSDFIEYRNKNLDKLKMSRIKLLGI